VQQVQALCDEQANWNENGFVEVQELAAVLAALAPQDNGDDE
jgi:hypothetical protein